MAALEASFPQPEIRKDAPESKDPPKGKARKSPLWVVSSPATPDHEGLRDMPHASQKRVSGNGVSPRTRVKLKRGKQAWM